MWIEGLDRVNKVRGINFCVDLSATPYYLGRVGQDTNAIPLGRQRFRAHRRDRSGLMKIPQLAVRDTTGVRDSRLLQHLALDSG